MMRKFKKRLTEGYQKYFAQKMFNKILMIYSLIVILTLVALSFFIYQYFSQYMMNKEAAREREAVSNVSAYIDQRIDASRMIVQSLNSNDYFLQNFSILLKKGYSEYLNYTLNQFLSADSSFTNSLKELSTFFNSGFNIESIIFSGQNGEFYRVKDQFSLEIISPEETGYKIPFQGGGGSDQSQIYPIPADKNGTHEPLYAVAAELKNPKTLELLSNMMILFRSNAMIEPNARIQDELKGNLLVTTREGDVIYDSSSTWYGRKFPVTNLMDKDLSDRVLVSGQDLYATVSMNNKAGVMVAQVVSPEELSTDTKGVKRWITFLTLVFILASVILTSTLIQRFSKRTKVIVRAMENLDISQRNVRIPLTEGDELYQIATNFNKLIERVNHHIEKEYISEIKQKNAEIVAMQMKINPHFLYNTLEAIRMNAVAQGAPEVGHMIYLLATLFRTSMKSAMVVKVTDEIERCRLYLELFQFRYPDRLKVQFDIASEIEQQEILKLSVQPIVENYVLHGFRTDRRDNWIHVIGAIDSGVMVIEVKDNGKGIPESKLIKLRELLKARIELEAETESIGLHNVNMRLQMLYGEAYGIGIESTSGTGTAITMKIPYINKE